MSYETERASIVARPCQCVTCADCRGTGTVWYSFEGRYLGNGRCDDLDDLRRCDMCEGGIVQQCDRCTDLEELEHAYCESEL